MHISEDFLHFIWQNQLAGYKFCLITGEICEVLHTGKGGNKDGPDFEAGQISINGLKLVGHIEIHLKSSDWFLHKHHLDPAYEKVILHVVMKHDKEVLDINNRTIPVLELRMDTLMKWKEHYEAIRMSNHSPFICSEYLSKLPQKLVCEVLQKKGELRLIEKAEKINKLFKASNFNWDECLYRMLMRDFGLNKNMEAMSMLAESLPWKFIAKERESLLSVEALLFGQAGLLKDLSDKNEYFQKLKNEYKYLSHKYKLKSISPRVWKYAPLRPSAMPDFRIAQIAALFHRISNLNSLVQSLPSKELMKVFSQNTSLFWKKHFTFNGKESKNRNTKPGNAFLELLIINSIAPYLYAWADEALQDSKKEFAIQVLKNCSAESNKIILTFVKELCYGLNSALESQGLIHLYKELCSARKCLKCPFIKDLMNLQGNHE